MQDPQKTYRTGWPECCLSPGFPLTGFGMWRSLITRAKRIKKNSYHWVKKGFQLTTAIVHLVNSIEAILLSITHLIPREAVSYTIVASSVILIRISRSSCVARKFVRRASAIRLVVSAGTIDPLIAEAGFMNAFGSTVALDLTRRASLTVGFIGTVATIPYSISDLSRRDAFIVVLTLQLERVTTNRTRAPSH